MRPTDLAEAKRLPADFLRGLGLHDLAAGEVGVPYWGPTGEEIAVKRRTALKAKDGSYWPTGTPLAAYGQWRIADATKAAFLIVVEGESDCWALWLHGLPALGLPGANTAKTLLREHVEAVATVYVHREPDAGGEAFVKGVQARLTALGFRGKAFELRMPAGVKDPADLHAADSDQFKAALESCIRAATPIPLGSRAADDGAAEAARGPTSDAWTAPIPFDAGHDLPAFPTHLLPAVLCEWVEAEAEATQTPPDLAGTLALSVCGAALAGKVRVVVRDGWAEPLNIFTVVALAPGERKSIVHRHALAPVVVYEREEQERMAPVIAAAASEHRQLEARLKLAETKAAKEEDPEERQRLCREAKELAKELSTHVVPETPQMFCDDVTAEALARLLAMQGGRMLQASPEGTAFEIVKGRYSESPNFDVYLKGHAGDPLRVGRIGRDGETVDQPALSAALAVQPDVIQGLAAQAILRGRGFLARWFYAMPVSTVGGRVIAARPVPKGVEAAYREAVLRLWRLEGAVEDGRPSAHLLPLSPEADCRMQDFEPGWSRSSPRASRCPCWPAGRTSWPAARRASPAVCTSWGRCPLAGRGIGPSTPRPSPRQSRWRGTTSSPTHKRPSPRWAPTARSPTRGTSGPTSPAAGMSSVSAVRTGGPV